MIINVSRTFLRSVRYYCLILGKIRMSANFCKDKKKYITKTYGGSCSVTCRHTDGQTRKGYQSTRNCFPGASKEDTTDSTVFLLQDSEPRSQENLLVLQHVASVFFNTNFGINFLLYCVSGQNFRRAFCSLCCSCARCPDLRRSSESSQVTGKFFFRSI